MRVPGLLALLLLVPALTGAVAGAPAASGAPAWYEATTLDRDGDRLDDALAPLVGRAGPVQVLVSYGRQPTDADARALEAAGAVVLSRYHHFPLLAARAPAHVVPDLLALPGVVFVEKDDLVRRQLRESVPLLGVPQAVSRFGHTGKDVVVAILDDGAFDQHPDLREKVVAAHDATGASADSPVDAPVGLVAPASQEGHATHVVGTVVGGGDQSGGLYKGVAPDARYVNVRVFSGPNETTSSIVLRGLDWVLDRHEDLGIRVVTLSMGGRPSDGRDALSRAVNLAVDEGLVIVAAAGNGGPDEGTVASPGAAAKAITVGAVDKRKRLADFSARGPTADGRMKPDVVAPGVAITSTVPPSGGAGGLVASKSLFYGSLSGTSMAAPHVAGVVAMMLESNPDLAPIDVKRILMATAQDLGAAGPDNETGYGFVNAIAAMQVVEDPELLESAELRARLESIPEPPEESILERLSYEMDSLARSGALVQYALLGVGIATVVGAGAWGWRKRQQQDGGGGPEP